MLRSRGFLHAQIQGFPPISVEIKNILKNVAEKLHEKIREYLQPETEQLIYQHLANVDFIVVSEVSGRLPRARLGLSQLDTPKAIYLVLQYQLKPRKILNLASTFWHELTHVANPSNDKLNSYKYLAAFMEVYLNSHLERDPHSDLAIKDIRESVPRGFQGALFGTPICRNPLWRQQYQPVVELVEEDQFTLFSPNPHPGERQHARSNEDRIPARHSRSRPPNTGILHLLRRGRPSLDPHPSRAGYLPLGA